MDYNDYKNNNVGDALSKIIGDEREVPEFGATEIKK